ncbi:MAG TPA: isochorismate synthase [Candidatus Dormibacteraeota bacterium]|jgi:salicylate biosynthesis isochorismate synthase/menaquinone-specific isochorismate synthase
MIAATGVRTWELDRTPDLVDLVSAARDAGHEVLLIERPMPDAVSVAALGRVYDMVAAPGGVALEAAAGNVVDFEPGDDRLQAAARLWRRVRENIAPAGPIGTGPIAVGGFAYRPNRDPGGPWSGFPAVLLRVPALAVTRVRGRTFATAAAAGAEELLELAPTGVRAPAARRLEVTSVRNPVAWTAAVESAAKRLRAGDAAKVVLAREVIARGDGVVSAGMVVRSLRAAYPSCFTYLVTGADGTAFAGASPELLIRRSGGKAFSQPMAGSVARGASEADDDRLARQLVESAKDNAEHRIASEFVVEALRKFSRSVEARAPEVVRFTNIQHLATSITAELAAPAAEVLDLAAALHPTPAVGGWPRPAAEALIDELEGLERGWYAGAVGWTDGQGDGEFAVALRCGLLWEDGARLYAGVGVMPDSDPARELEETELKFKALLMALT